MAKETETKHLEAPVDVAEVKGDSLLEENHIQDHPSSRRSIHGGSMKRNRAYH
jgi:hypothetical protein